VQPVKCLIILVALVFETSALAQTIISFGATLSGDEAIPTNNFGVSACGRLWLQGTNLAYRFVGGLARTTIEIHGPAGRGTNGPLLYVLPFSYFGTSDDYCRSAAGLPSTNANPEGVPYHPPFSVVNEGAISLTHEEVEYLMVGLLYASRTAFIAREAGTVVEKKARGQITLLDSDSDGVPDFQDQCPNTHAGAIINSNGCSIEQLCPCEGPWRNHGEFLNCMRNVLREFSHAGLITIQQHHQLFRAAAESNCGKVQQLTGPTP
jgi:hypothetical protein